MTYDIWLDPKAQDDLERLAPGVRQRIVRKLAELRALGPRHPQVRRLTAVEGEEYRLRVGDWRVRFEARETPAEIMVLRVLHRSQVYKD